MGNMAFNSATFRHRINVGNNKDSPAEVTIDIHVHGCSNESGQLSTATIEKAGKAVAALGKAVERVRRTYGFKEEKI